VLAAAPAGSPQTPIAVVQQLVQVSGQLGRGPIEVSLSPDELGRVRMTLSPADGGMVLSILADRDDTLALLRRNMDMLANDLRDLGYHNLSFQFGSGGSGAGQHDTGPGRPILGTVSEKSETGAFAQPQQPRSRLSTDRLDLRL
jgi:flagellar hook-length control protein FliK